MTPNYQLLRRYGLAALLLAAIFFAVRHTDSHLTTENLAQSPLAPASGQVPRSSPVVPVSPESPRFPEEQSPVTPAINPDDLIARFQQSGDVRERSEFVSAALAQLAAEAPGEAVAFAAGLPEGPWRIPVLMQALEILATSGDPGKALAEAARLLPETELDPAQTAIATGWARHSPEDAMSWALALTDGAGKSSAIDGIAARWGENDPAAVIAWLNDQPDLDCWEQVFHTVTSAWSSSTPEEALAWAHSQSEAEPQGPNPVSGVLMQWSQSAPGDAAAALRQEPAVIQQEAAATVARNLAWLDLDRASAWAEGLVDPTARQAALAAVEEARSPLAADSP